MERRVGYEKRLLDMEEAVAVGVSLYTKLASMLHA
jgi:hypothetical protein